MRAIWELNPGLTTLLGSGTGLLFVSHCPCIRTLLNSKKMELRGMMEKKEMLLISLISFSSFIYLEFNNVRGTRCPPLSFLPIS